MAGKINFATMARVLGEFTREPMSVHTATKFIGCTRENAFKFIRQMRAAGMLRIVDWECRHNNPIEPVYMAIPGPDMECPKFRPSGDPANPRLPTSPVKFSTNFIAFKVMIEALKEGDISRDELAEVSGVAHNTVERFLSSMRREKLVYCSGWNTEIKPYVQLLSFGNKRGVPKPKAPERKELHRRYRQRVKENRSANILMQAFAANSDRMKDAA